MVGTEGRGCFVFFLVVVLFWFLLSIFWFLFCVGVFGFVFFGFVL